LDEQSGDESIGDEQSPSPNFCPGRGLNIGPVQSNCRVRYH